MLPVFHTTVFGGVLPSKSIYDISSMFTYRQRSGERLFQSSLAHQPRDVDRVANEPLSPSLILTEGNMAHRERN
jgi:hypothetical protein